jgi:hypothetical protein
VNAEPQEIVTSNKLNARIDAQVYFKVENDEESAKSLQHSVKDCRCQMVNLAGATLNDIIGTLTLESKNRRCLMAKNAYIVDAERSRTRALRERVDLEVSSLPSIREGEPPEKASPGSWRDLVGLLALGPKLEVRECPVCKHVGVRPATLCDSCWQRLTHSDSHVFNVG